MSGGRLSSAGLQKCRPSDGRTAGSLQHSEGQLHHPPAPLGERLPLQRCVSAAPPLGFLRAAVVIFCFFGLAESAVRFEGKSYLSYLHGMDEDHQDFRLALSFRTSQEQSLIASTNSTTDWGVLQVLLPPRSFRQDMCEYDRTCVSMAGRVWIGQVMCE